MTERRLFEVAESETGAGIRERIEVGRGDASVAGGVSGSGGDADVGARSDVAGGR